MAGSGCHRVLPVVIMSGVVGFMFGIIYSKTDITHLHGLKNLKRYAYSENAKIRGGDVYRDSQNQRRAERLSSSTSSFSGNNESNSALSPQYIDSICSIKDIGGKVLSRDNASWSINDKVCNGKSEVMSTFVRANLKGPQKTPIYVYDAKSDVWISGNILRQGMWEGDLVRKIHNILQRDKDMDTVFIDMGANVGVFSLTAAKLGRKVIAIDALHGNIVRLCKSVEAGNFKNNTVIIYNALSNTRERVALGTYKGNIGGTYVKKLNMNIEEKYVVNTILLDDLLEIFTLKRAVIKMDVETFEAKVLEGGSRFFSTVDVTHLLMEFSSHRKSKSGEYIINFLKEHGLEPQVNADVIKDYSKWPGDVLFKKNGV